MKSRGYKLEEKIQTFAFGQITAYNILNEDEKYGDYVKTFLRSLPQEKLSEPYESFKKEFSKLQTILSLKSSKFGVFKSALQEVLCQKEILNLSETLDNLVSLKNKFRKQFKGTDEEFEAIDKSLKLFLAEFPQEVLEYCEDSENHKSFVENKIKLLDVLDLKCQ